MENQQMNLPEGWISVIMHKLGKTYSGLTGKTKIDFGEGKPYVPYINVFKNVRIDLEALEYVRIGDTEHQNQVLYGDLLFTTSSETIEEVGMTSVVLGEKEELYLNSFCFGFRLHNFDVLMPEYACYLFRTQEVRKSISLLGQGSTRFNLPKTKLLSGLVLNLPTLPEQQKIASILSKIDEAIAHTEALIAKYEQIKTGLMQDLLTRGITGKTANVVKSKLKGLYVNESFVHGKMSDITKVRQGFQIEISLRKKEEGLNRHKYITIQYLNNPAKYLEYIENPPLDVICTPDDILVTRTGNTGYIVTDVSGVYHNNFFRVNYDKKLITKDYLVTFLTWQPTQDVILELAGTTTIPDLNHKDFYSVPIFFPKSIEEQKEIVKIIAKASDSIKNHETELTKLLSLKSGLMQDLLSGRVRV